MAKKIETIVSVTKNDIEHGERADCSLCPVALAIKRRFPKAYAISVGSYSAYVLPTKKSRTLEAMLPERVSDFIINFDASEEVKPIRFNAVFKAAYDLPF